MTAVIIFFGLIYDLYTPVNDVQVNSSALWLFLRSLRSHFLQGYSNQYKRNMPIRYCIHVPLQNKNFLIHQRQANI